MSIVGPSTLKILTRHSLIVDNLLSLLWRIIRIAIFFFYKYVIKYLIKDVRWCEDDKNQVMS